MQQDREPVDNRGRMFCASGVKDPCVTSKFNSGTQSQFTIKDIKKTIPERMQTPFIDAFLDNLQQHESGTDEVGTY